MQHEEDQKDQFKSESECKRTALPESSFPASPPGVPTLAYQVDSMHFEEGRSLILHARVGNFISAPKWIKQLQTIVKPLK